MSDHIAISGDSPEAVAFALLSSIAACEDKSTAYGIIDQADRDWILRTYAACLAAVRAARA